MITVLRTNVRPAVKVLATLWGALREHQPAE
jgi:hypothetical protein